MKIAFYAPLNSPNAARPSGDRLIARMLMAALERGGHDVRLASEFRSLDKTGDATRQRTIRDEGLAAARTIIDAAGLRHAGAWRPDLWLTYHLYYKAPDWLGPEVSRALSIPYVLAEASFAPKRARGPWHLGHEAVANAIAAAKLVIGLNSLDAACVRPQMSAGARYKQLRPFIDCTAFLEAGRKREAHRARLSESISVASDTTILITAGMMREGAKRASYEVLAEALGLLADRNWQLVVVGDGPVRQAIEADFARFPGRVHLLGEKHHDELPALFAGADLFVWPAVDEALGMVFIEAQAAGTPVVGSRTLGVPDVVAHGTSGILAAPRDARDFAAAVDRLLQDDQLRMQMGVAAAQRAVVEHDISTAGRHLCTTVESIWNQGKGAVV